MVWGEGVLIRLAFRLPDSRWVNDPPDDELWGIIKKKTLVQLLRSLEHGVMQQTETPSRIVISYSEHEEEERIGEWAAT